MWTDFWIGLGSGFLANLISTPFIALILFAWKKLKEFAAREYISENKTLQEKLKIKDTLLETQEREIFSYDKDMKKLKEEVERLKSRREV